jgi:tripartite-type tricarboxylate transporter receptor subunit TctC
LIISLLAFAAGTVKNAARRSNKCSQRRGTMGGTFMRRFLRRELLAGAGLALLATPAVAQDYPSRPVRIIVPFGPGGPADVYARALGQHLSDALKQQFVVDNRPGAGAVIGTDMVAKSAPDGYTLLMMSNTHTTNETLLANKPYALMKDLVPVVPVNSSDLVMVVHPSVQAKTLQEFIALAKASPGKLSYASSGPGTPYHMAGELFKAMSGTDILHVPHRGSGEARSSVMGGHVQMMLDAVTAMAGNVSAGSVRALATSGRQRSSVLPQVPTVAEAGVPGYEATIWLGIMAPAGTPPAVVERLSAEIARVIARPDIREAWAKQGAVPMTMTPAEFGTFLKADIEKWARVIERSGAKAQ